MSFDAEMLPSDGKRDVADPSAALQSLAQRVAHMPPFSPASPEMLEWLLPLARGGAPTERVPLSNAVEQNRTEQQTLKLKECMSKAKGLVYA